LLYAAEEQYHDERKRYHDKKKKGGRAMQDFIKKVKLLSVGLFYMGKEKVEESVAELIKKGEITEKEGKALVNELVVKSKAATKDLEGRIHKVLSDAQDKLHAPLKKEIDVLKKRLAKLEKEGAAAKARSMKKTAKSPRKSAK
jgi:polyhydroxyalkanoate synthesis regulator phasin